MAFGFMAEDFVAFCLYFANGHRQIPMNDLFARVEAYEESRVYFEEHPGDFRRACSLMLGAVIPVPGMPNPEAPASAFEGLILEQFITPILKKHTYYSNDEGEWWEWDERRPYPPRNRLMHAFLLKKESRSPAAVMKFLLSHGWDHTFIEACTSGIYQGYEMWARYAPEVVTLRKLLKKMEKGEISFASVAEFIRTGREP